VTGDAPVEIHRFYVDRPHHGTGLAQQLMAAARATAVEMGGRTLWLGVWERNPRAIAYYAKSGLRDVGSADFFVGPDRQTDRIMAGPLDPPTRG
jgi:GNAT superfamily N-acetyltransferase